MNTFNASLNKPTLQKFWTNLLEPVSCTSSFSPINLGLTPRTYKWSHFHVRGVRVRQTYLIIFRNSIIRLKVT